MLHVNYIKSELKPCTIEEIEENIKQQKTYRAPGEDDYCQDMEAQRQKHNKENA